MARPTRLEKEKQRIADLLAEGKDSNGDPIEEANVISETKNPAKPSNQPVQNAEFSIADLNAELENATLGKGASTSNTETKEEKTIDGSDFRKPDTDDPNYIKTEGHNRFSESMIENESDANKAASGPSVTNIKGSGQPLPNTEKDFAEPVINGAGTTQEKTEAEKKAEAKPLNPDFEKLSPTEKREQVEMFADSILTTYAQLLPILPTLICSYNMNKMEIMDRDGKLRLSMIISRDEETGELTVREQFLAHNQDVEAVFVVTDEMKAELRDPLIAVLMEKGIAPTPMTTLLIGIGRHCLMFAIGTYKLLSKKSQELDTFIAFRKEEMENERSSHKESQHNPTPAAEVKESKKEASVVSMDAAISSEVSTVKVKSNLDNSGITMEDVVAEVE